MSEAGQIVILNGQPRSGKSSIARAIQESFEGVWLNLGVDFFMQASPADIAPSIGLRPGGERPDLEPAVLTVYRAAFEAIAAVSRLGVNVVSDFGLHDSYALLTGVPESCIQRLAGLPVFVVGVRCPVDVLLERRRQSGWEQWEDAEARVRLWDREVHRCLSYDMEVDTSKFSPEECARRIAARLGRG